CGVTTVLALLGTDCVSRSLENVLAKSRSLTEDGISAYMLTGSYRIPSPTMTGDIMKDMVLIDKVIGVKVALSDHRSSVPTVEELARLFSEARVGGMVGGKAGLTVVHMGRGVLGTTGLIKAAEMSDTSLDKILPTHCGRNDQTFEDAVAYSQKGGNFDLTADAPMDAAKNGGAARWVSKALARGVDIKKITISSDGYGSQPKFNEKMECIGMTYSRCNTVHDEFCRMVKDEKIPMEDALKTITSNVAERMGLTGIKGVIAPGADADLVVWDNELNISKVYARGKLAYADGQAILKGRFE
ncbi:MAG: beta-aspartyl-peptidase, partial [Lachnospiraceae bacterium]|nr:beta-aspartyl-peptidase [Lachnospiraceae bacterium]